MGVLFMNTGVTDGFDTVTSVMQNITKGRTGGYALYNNTASARLRKLIPLRSELYVACFCLMDNLEPPAHRIIEFFNGATTSLGRLYYNNSTNLFEAINGSGTVLGTSTTPWASYGSFHIEVHFKQGTTDGVFQVWINGVLEINYTGNTGASSQIDGVEWKPYYYYLSDMIIRDDQRCYDTRVGFLTPKAAGELSEWDVEVAYGEAAIDRNSYSNYNYTYIPDEPVLAGGAVKKIEYYGNAAGNIKIARFTKSGNSFTPVAIIANLAGGDTFPVAVGLNTLNAGANFAEFNVAPGEYVGFYVDATARLEGTKYGSDPFNVYTSSGDKTAVGVAYTPNLATAEGYSFRLTVLLTNKADYYLFAADPATVIYTNTPNMTQLVTEGIPFLPIGTVHAVSLTITGNFEGTSGTTSLDIVCKKGTAEQVSATQALSTVAATKQALFDTNPETGGAWSKANIDGVQLGVRSR